jgi:hypothetical protein
MSPSLKRIEKMHKNNMEESGLSHSTLGAEYKYFLIM